MDEMGDNRPEVFYQKDPNLELTDGDRLSKQELI
jgi:hypothetical protein